MIRLTNQKPEFRPRVHSGKRRAGPRGLATLSSSLGAGRLSDGGRARLSASAPPNRLARASHASAAPACSTALFKRGVDARGRGGGQRRSAPAVERRRAGYDARARPAGAAVRAWSARPAACVHDGAGGVARAGVGRERPTERTCSRRLRGRRTRRGIGAGQRRGARREDHELCRAAPGAYPTTSHAVPASTAGMTSRIRARSARR